MSSPLKRKTRRARAFTLAELVVAMGIMLIISGLILGILIETRRSTARAQAQLTMQIKAERSLEYMTSILQAAVAPSSLDAPVEESAPVDNTPIFTAKKCVLLHSKRFRTSAGAGKGIEWAQVYVITPNKIAGSASSPSEPPPPYSTTFDFKYATEIKAPGAELIFKDSLQGNEYPRVIQVRVRVQDRSEKLDPYELVTAVKML